MRWGRTESMRRPVHAALVAIVLIVSAGPTSALAATPTDGGPITLLPVVINAGSGDQYDPHVNGDLAVYTSENNVRYYDFFTGNDAQVPAPVDATDRLSDVSGGRIVFSRDEASGRSPIMVFDTGAATLVEVDPQPVPVRTQGAIGSDTVAFVDYSVNGTGEIYASQLGLGNTQRVTNDARFDQHPEVAPLGGLLVYESCQTDPANCDIHQAAWNGSSWSVSSLTNNSEPEANAGTDGTIVVYDATRASDRDIYWQHVGGDAEQHLALAGEQRNPSVSAGGCGIREHRRG
jgi:hypothetical protein